MDRYRMLPTYRYYDVEGTSPLTLDKSVGKPLRDYKIYGNSVQDGTPSPENPVEVQSFGDKSKNLVDMSKVSRGYLNQSGEVLNSSGLQTSDFIDVSNISNISISSAKSYAFYDEEKVFISSEIKSMTIFRNYTIPENAKYIRFDWQTEKVNGDIVYAFAGSYTEDTFPPYEPYGYKIPIEVGGKNLFDIENTTYYDGYLKSSGEVTSDVSFKYTDYIEVNSDSITLTLVYGGLNAPSICAYDKDKNYLTGVKYGGKTIINLNHRDMKYVRFSLTTVVIRDKANILLENGSVSTDFEPYIEPQTFNIYLDEPLYKIGDYADYIDFKNGKVVRNIFEYTFVGNEFSTAPFGDLGTSVRAYTKTIMEGLTPEQRIGFSEIGVFDGGYTSVGDEERCQYSHNASSGRTLFYARILKSRCADPNNPTADDFNKIYAAGTKVYGVRGTPIEQPIDLPPILTHKGTNVISVGTEIQPSNMQIQYYK